MIGTGATETMSEHRNYSPATAGSATGQTRRTSAEMQQFGQLPPVLPPLGPSELQIDLSSVMLQSEIEAASPSFSIPTPEPVAAEDQQLVQQCLQGDDHAWSRLIDKYKRLIYSVPIKYGFRPEDASDIFQTVCIDLFTNLCNLRKVGSLRSWLITVTSHKCFHWKRQQRQDIELDALEQEIAEDLATAPEMLQELQQEQIVRDAVDRLPPRCAEMVRLLFFEQPPLPYAEVARRLGLAVGSIGFIRGRCLTRLHKILMELGF
ncbi:MAG TPA: sigma-70 family RNA polymerase sigma factor [Candidatus Angelobacter sp.]|jgi:RNA polymerase sigma factor (sigma-70 family)|nr:sigma-70 family RNA polymerase sigma factor [Candidatus Angelobacter sp.]